MNVKIEFLEISPRIKYLKTNPSEIISISLHSGNNNSKIYDLEKAIKEQQKINFVINSNNTIKLSLLKNNSNIIGTVEFTPSNETKWLNIKECKNISSNENVLTTTSSHKMKMENIYDNTNSSNNNNYYYTTIKNNTIENNSSLKKYNTKSIITFPDACINNNIKLKISMKINHHYNKSNKKTIKNNSINSQSTITRGSSQIILNLPEYNNTINKSKNKNISMSNINDKMTPKYNNIITDNSLRLKKKLKNAKSTSSIKLSINNIMSNNKNKLSLNTIYTTINSTNKSKMKKANDNFSLIDQKQKTQYNFNPKKNFMNEENEKNNILNNNYYNNTITIESNNKKIEDLIIDNNFKNKLKSDEIINPTCSVLKTTNFQKNLNKIKPNNPINRDILDQINKVSTLNNESNNYKIKTKKNNSSLSVPDVKYEYNLINGITKMNNYKDIILSSFLVSIEDNEFVKNFETIKNDVIIYYTKEYLNSINDDMLYLELKLLIEKILQLKYEYQTQIKYLFQNFIYYKTNIKTLQQNHINMMKKNNKLQSKIMNNLFLNNNLNIFLLGNKQYLSSEKTIIDKTEINILNNSMDKTNKNTNKNKNNENKIDKKNKLIEMFLFVCEKNVNNLNSLTKRYYFEIKKRKNKNKIENIKEQCISELSALITIQNVNTNDKDKDKEDNCELINFNNKTIKTDLKVKKYYENIKTTNKDDKKKKAKYNLFFNSKSTDKKSKKKKIK